jgi:hypothetical protein
MTEEQRPQADEDAIAAVRKAADLTRRYVDNSLSLAAVTLKLLESHDRAVSILQRLANGNMQSPTEVLKLSSDIKKFLEEDNIALERLRAKGISDVSTTPK